MKKEAALFVAGVIFAAGAAAQVYKCPDASGKTVIQQVPCTGGKRMTVRPGSGFDTQTQWKIDEDKRRKEREKEMKELEESLQKAKLEDAERKERLEKEWEEKRQKEKEAHEQYRKACEAIGIKDFIPLRIGMSKDQVLCIYDRVLMKPDKINTTRTATEC